MILIVSFCLVFHKCRSTRASSGCAAGTTPASRANATAARDSVGARKCAPASRTTVTARQRTRCRVSPLVALPSGWSRFLRLSVVACKRCNHGIILGVNAITIHLLVRENYQYQIHNIVHISNLMYLKLHNIKPIQMILF